jgi:hypothetical protein
MLKLARRNGFQGFPAGHCIGAEPSVIVEIDKARGTIEGSAVYALRIRGNQPAGLPPAQGGDNPPFNEYITLDNAVLEYDPDVFNQGGHGPSLYHELEYPASLC